jgi:colanic acid/amylovoran biosynthesis glycosyltransferase
VADLARIEGGVFDTVVVAPAVPGARLRETWDGFEIRRFRFFPRRWEDLAAGAILENLRARRSRWLQVPSFFVAGALAVRGAVRASTPDVIHVHWIIPQGLMALVAARRVPWLVTTLGGDLYALTSRPARFVKKLVLKRARAVTVMNEDMRSMVVALGVPPERVQVLTMGVDLQRVRRSGSGLERVPGKLIFVGRLVEKKGLGVLLRALHHLPADLAWSLDVIGDGPLRSELEDSAQGLGERVIFHGQRGAEELGHLLGRAQVAVFPSVRARSGDQDGLPVAMLEAMAAGTPVVASDLPGLRDAVRGEPEAGVVVPPEDDHALAAALQRLLVDDDLRARLGRQAASRAEGYSVEAIGARYIDLLRDAVQGTIGTQEDGR